MPPERVIYIYLSHTNKNHWILYLIELYKIIAIFVCYVCEPNIYLYSVNNNYQHMKGKEEL